MKITFMGAGSTVFAKNVLGDCMVSKIITNFEIALYDIDEKRLDDSQKMLEAVKRFTKAKVKIKSYLGICNIAYPH